ncbi:MAG: hypothetical protein ABIF40_00060 [archaeon]
MKKKVKQGLCVLTMMSSMYLGDYCNVIDNVVNPVRYRNTIVAEECYNEPFDLKKMYRINGQGELEVYLGANGEYYLVEDELRVHPKTFKEFTEQPFKEISGFLGKILEKYFRVTWEI